MLAVLAALSLAPAVVFRTAEIDVTPPEPLPLGGYTARKDAVMEAGGDPLFARALVIESGGNRLAIVSFESLTVPESLYRSVKGKIPSGVSLLLVATHTHSAPDSQMLNDRMTFKVPGIAPFNRRWLDWYASKIAEAVQSALDGKPHDGGTLRLVEGDVNASHGRREGAEPIRRTSYLVSSGKPVLTVYAAHGTVFDERRNQTSGDWPGAYAKAVGGLVLPGPIGDVSPDTPSATPGENVAFIVEKLRSGLVAGEVMDLWSKGTSVACVEEPIALDKAVPSPAFAKEFGAASPLDQVLVQRFAPPSAFVTVARMGDMLVVGVPGEPSSQVGRKILAFAGKLGFPHTVVVSHCNGWIGYVLEPEDYDRGGYEAALSFNGRETGLRVAEAAERGLRRLLQPVREAQTR